MLIGNMHSRFVADDKVGSDVMGFIYPGKDSIVAPTTFISEYNPQPLEFLALIFTLIRLSMGRVVAA